MNFPPPLGVSPKLQPMVMQPQSIGIGQMQPVHGSFISQVSSVRSAPYSSGWHIYAV
jgi:hypothetical protein